MERPNLTGHLDITADQVRCDLIPLVEDHSVDCVVRKLGEDGWRYRHSPTLRS